MVIRMGLLYNTIAALSIKGGGDENKVDLTPGEQGNEETAGAIRAPVDLRPIPVRRTVEAALQDD